MERRIKVFKTPITESNCNARLNVLYQKRDKIGKTIDRLQLSNIDELLRAEEKRYDDICAEIKELCEYRRNHKCLTEGDKGFGL